MKAKKLSKNLKKSNKILYYQKPSYIFEIVRTIQIRKNYNDL